MSALAKTQEVVQPNRPHTYYVNDFSKLEIAELWRLASGKRAYMAKCMALFAKLRGNQMRRGVPSLYDNAKLIDPQDIPENFLRSMESRIAALESAGFVRSLSQQAAQSKRVRGFSVHLLSADRLSAASVIAVQGWIGNPVPIESTITIATRRCDGVVFGMTDARRRLKQPPEVKIQHLSHATPDQLIAKHRRQIVNCVDAETIKNEELAEKLVSRRHRQIEFQVSRGVFVPATADEMNRHRVQIVPYGEF
jgi:hypothetical protein